MSAEAHEPGDDLADEGPASTETDEPASAPKPLPEHVTDDGASWVYALQHPLEPDGKGGLDPERVRVTKRVYARHVLEASKGNPTTRAEGVFAMACALTGLPAAVLRRLDLRDYEVVCSLCDRSGTPDATASPR